MSDSKFYVKGEVMGVEVRTPFEGTVYTKCANCGAEFSVDIISVIQGDCEEYGADEAPDLFEGNWHCDHCSQAILQETRGEGQSGAILPFRAKNSDDGAGV